MIFCKRVMRWAYYTETAVTYILIWVYNIYIILYVRRKEHTQTTGRAPSRDQSSSGEHNADL